MRKCVFSVGGVCQSKFSRMNGLEEIKCDGINPSPLCPYNRNRQEIESINKELSQLV